MMTLFHDNFRDTFIHRMNKIKNNDPMHKKWLMSHDHNEHDSLWLHDSQTRQHVSIICNMIQYIKEGPFN